MTIASVGTLGTGSSGTSSSTFTLSTATNTLASGDFGILIVAADNRTGSDGNNGEHTAVSGGTGKWRKLGEWTNTVGGAAADGVTTSVWLFEASGTVSTGTTITITTGTCVDKTATFWKFTKAAGTKIVHDLAATQNFIGNTQDASNGFGSVAFASLPSSARLYLRGLGKEANTTTALTPSTSFTAITNSRSSNTANAICAYGEFRINTSTGETSNPTLAVSGDTSGVFVALKEVTPLTTAPANDNFDDNSLNTSFWNDGQPHIGTRSATATVNEQNQRLELTNGVSATGYRGITTVNAYDFTQGLRAYVKITPSATLPSNNSIQLAIGPDPLNYYSIWITSNGTSMTFNSTRTVNGVGGGWGGFAGTAYSNATHGWLSLRYNTGDGRVYAEYAPPSPDPPTSWTALGSETAQPDLSAACVGLYVGAFSAAASPVRVDFDGFDGATTAGGTGTLSQTLGTVTLSSSANLLLKGTVSKTLGVITLGSNGQLKLSGSLSKPLGTVTLSSSSKLLIKGSLSKTLGALVSTETGVLLIKGSLNKTLGVLTLSATGTHPALTPIAGTLTATLSPIILVSIGDLLLEGSLNATLGGVTLTTSARTVRPFKIAIGSMKSEIADQLYRRNKVFASRAPKPRR